MGIDAGPSGVTPVSSLLRGRANFTARTYGLGAIHLPTAEVCRKHRLSPATFYKLKGKYGGMEVSEARRLRMLEDENAKLKRLLAESVLDNAILKDLLGKV